MQDNLLSFGVNAPRPHQRIIRQLTGELHSLYMEGNITLEPFPETMIDEGQTSAVPDILLADNQNQKVPIIIEVTTSASLKSDIRKVQELMNDYDVTEGFVYNYQKSTWYKFVLGIGEVTTNPSYSDLIKQDFDKMIQ